MTDHPKPPPFTTRINSQGLVEYVDIFTGQTLAIQPTPNDDFLHNRFENLVKIDTPEGPVYIEKHLDPARVLNKRTRKPVQQFSLSWAHLLANALLDVPAQATARFGIDPDPNDRSPGVPPRPLPAVLTLAQACQKYELPTSLVSRWRNESEEFNAIIDSSLQAQAQWLQDEALTTARLTTRKDDVPIAALQIDTLMKQAKSADSSRFGDKQKLDVRHTAVHTIVVETGIRRHADPEALLPKDFAEALRDATPKDKISLPGQEAGIPSAETESGLPIAVQESDQERADIDERSRAESADWEEIVAPPRERAEQKSLHMPEQQIPKLRRENLPRMQTNQSIRPAKSILESAASVIEDSTSQPIPDISDSDW